MLWCVAGSEQQSGRIRGLQFYEKGMQKSREAGAVRDELCVWKFNRAGMVLPYFAHVDCFT